MIKDIALVVDGHGSKAGPYALSLASLLDSHVTAISAVVEPHLEAYAYAELRYDMVASARAELRDAAYEVAKRLATEGGERGLKVSSLAFDCFEDADFTRFKEFLRIFDLIVIEQSNPEQAEGRTRTIESLVFGASRPVLVVPYIHSSPASLKNVLVAWDGSAPAARAVGDAMPLLERADRVEVLSIDRKGLKDFHEQGAAVTRHLARHGVDAVFKHTTSAGDVGSTILSYASDCGSDLLVMGAYGHSRLREAVFGGATRTLLESMTIPVLMSR